MGVDGLMFFFFQAEDGIRELVRSRGLGDVYKRQDRKTPYERSDLIPECHAPSSGRLSGQDQ